MDNTVGDKTRKISANAHGIKKSNRLEIDDCIQYFIKTPTRSKIPTNARIKTRKLKTQIIANYFSIRKNPLKSFSGDKIRSKKFKLQFFKNYFKKISDQKIKKLTMTKFDNQVLQIKISNTPTKSSSKIDFSKKKPIIELDTVSQTSSQFSLELNDHKTNQDLQNFDEVERTKKQLELCIKQLRRVFAKLSEGITKSVNNIRIRGECVVVLKKVIQSNCSKDLFVKANLYVSSEESKIQEIDFDKIRENFESRIQRIITLLSSN